jgi:cyclophilin family peptidyl-prolyl cis-trans isomerase/HEAT repeat protein
MRYLSQPRIQSLVGFLCTALLLGACGGPRGGANGGMDPALAKALASIARLEDQRSDGGGSLQANLQDPMPVVRQRAALALGRLPLAGAGAGASAALLQALADSDAEVRAEAWFALGQLADPAALEAMLVAAASADQSPVVQAATVRALGAFDEQPARDFVVQCMGSANADVRAEAAAESFRWSMDSDDAAAVDAALIALVRAEPEGNIARWTALFSLSRRRAESAVSLGIEVLRPRSGAWLERVYAVRLLARQTTPLNTEARIILQRCLSDGNLHVATEAALGLAEHGNVNSLPSLRAATGKASFHLRAAAARALGQLGQKQADAWLQVLAEDASASVRLAALGARLELGTLDQPLASILAAAESDPQLRAGAPELLAKLGGDAALNQLLKLCQDPAPGVAGAALGALTSFPDEATHAHLLSFLDSPDNGLRIAAIDALAPNLRPLDLAALAQAHANAQGDIAAEVRVQARLAVEGAQQRLGQEHQAALQAWLETTEEPQGTTKAALLPPLWPLESPNPSLTLITTRGELVFELFPLEAPVHVHSFLELAAAGHYDGLLWHRVVSDFVAQGGCYRGDGNGSGTWRAPDDALRHEFGARRYVRGSLGMPRNANPESGGNQIFVTHRPTPHLDRRYTIFGELRAGFGVLDRLQQGDHILGTKIHRGKLGG